MKIVLLLNHQIATKMKNKTLQINGIKSKVTYRWIYKNNTTLVTNITAVVINDIPYPLTVEVSEIMCNNGSTGMAKYYIYDGVKMQANDKKLIELILSTK